MRSVARPGGITIPYNVVGDGGERRMIFTHSLTATALHAGELYAPLTQSGWTIVTLDQRGHGAASAPLDPACYTPAAMGGDLLAILDDLGWERAWLGGGSMGCVPALAAAAAAPERIEGLALVAPAFGRTRNVAADAFAGIAAALRDGGLEAGLDAWATWSASQGMAAAATEQQLTQLRPHEPTAMGIWLAEIGGWTIPDEMEALRDFPGPVVCMAWEGDDIHPYALATELAALAPRGSVSTISWEEGMFEGLARQLEAIEAVR